MKGFFDISRLPILIPSILYSIMSQKSLQPPGAGLPPLEAFISRHVVFPLATFILDDPLARALFLREGEQIARLAEGLEVGRLEKKVLIPRITGIEDSSRNWSVAMTLEHLLITGEAMMNMILTLRQGQKSPVKVDTADVKPTGTGLDDVLSRYEQFQKRFDQMVAVPFQPYELLSSHDHPWFGALNARQWHVLAAIHTRIHRVQIARIITLM